MKKLILLVMLLAVALGIQASSQTVGLEGTVLNQDGSGFNGTLYLRLGSTGKVNNICGTPLKVVPNVTSQWKVQNGSIVNGTSAQIVTQDCMSYRVPYYAELKDSNGALVYSDNWYLPSVAGALVDVGTMAAEKFTGPIVVSIPQGIIATPVGDQTITQPTGTALKINNLTVTGILLGQIPLATAAQQWQNAPNNCGSGQAPTGTTVTGASQNCTSYVQSLQSGSYVNVVNLGNGVWQVNATGAANPKYQTINANGTSVAQEPALNFSTQFAVTDNSGVATNIGLATTGVTAQAYASPSSVTVNAFGQITSITGGTAGPVYNLQVAKLTNPCSTPGGSYATCTSTLSWPTGFPNTNYSPVCSGVGPGIGQGGSAIALNVLSYTQSSVTVVTQSMRDDNGSRFSEISCYGLEPQ